jgi:aminoglycoside phosphotransferase (APT) family kinase protein
MGDGEPNVAPSELLDALAQMARFLVHLHALPTDAFAVAQLNELEDPAEALLAHLPTTETGDRLRRALRADKRERVDNPHVLVHGDFWPGNVLWQAGRIAAVIDWEDASLGDPLADLACARVELLCRYGGDAMNHFTDRYLAISHEASRRPRLDCLALWEVYVSASALATMHRWGLDPDDETHRRTHTTRFFERAAGELLTQL